MLSHTNKEKQLEIEEKINTLFINLVNDADKISQQPLKNYLNESLIGF
jgi:hypothetical protein